MSCFHPFLINNPGFYTFPALTQPFSKHPSQSPSINNLTKASYDRPLPESLRISRASVGVGGSGIWKSHIICDNNEPEKDPFMVHNLSTSLKNHVYWLPQVLEAWYILYAGYLRHFDEHFCFMNRFSRFKVRSWMFDWIILKKNTGKKDWVTMVSQGRGHTVVHTPEKCDGSLEPGS
jgi:hypothetical protein